MRVYFVFLCAFGTLVTLGLADSPAPNTPGFTCTPGQSFKHECNDCRCAPNGKVAACTFKSCITKRDIVEGHHSHPAKCKFGTSKHVDCNICKCLKNGRWVCTERGCLTKSKRDAEAPCKQGDRKKEDCNICRCGKNGEWACTKSVCPDRSKRDVSEPECEIGQTKKDDCNTCRCIKGGKWACTRMKCLSKRETSECKVGETKKEHCNTCKCLKGGIWSCTRKHCHTKREACHDGEQKLENCNKCKCLKGNWACTKKFCAPGESPQADPIRTRREDPIGAEFNATSCAPTDTFKVDCNTCYCKTDGTGYTCTEKVCSTATESTKE